MAQLAGRPGEESSARLAQQANLPMIVTGHINGPSEAEMGPKVVSGDCGLDPCDHFAVAGTESLAAQPASGGDGDLGHASPTHSVNF